MLCTNCGKETPLTFSNPKRSKYGSVRTFSGGRHYQSQLEARVGDMLDLAVKGKLIKSYEWQVVIAIYVSGVWIANYKCDFRVIHNDKSVEWIEAKGEETERFRIIRRLMLLYLQENPKELYTIYKNDHAKEFFQNGKRVSTGKFWKQ